MPSFVVGDIEITDPVAYQAHVPSALATIARSGGRVIAGGGKVHFSKAARCRSGCSSSNFRTPMRRRAGIGPMIIRPH